MIGRTLGPYRILEKSAVRDAGAVYRARDEAHGRDVDLIVLPAGAIPDNAERRRLHVRVRAYARVDHPAVATVYALERRDGIDFLVLEHVPGVTLAEKPGAAFPAPLAERLGRELREGLTALHAAGVVHGAVRPDHVMITPDLRLQILDPAVPQAGTDSAAADLRAADEILATLPAAVPSPTPSNGRRFRRPRLRHALAGGVALAALPFAIVALDLDRPMLRWAREGDDIESISVLPMASGEAPEERIFADGVTDALIMSLSGIRGLRVISRTSAMRYRDSELGSSRIAAELGVDAVVEGSVSRAGDRIRIAVRLIDGLTGRTRWTATYDREAADVAQLQKEIAADIVGQVEVRVTAEESYRVRRSHVVDPAALAAYLEGRHHLERRTPAGLEAGMRHLHTAVETDPGYALAWAGLANGYALLASTGYDAMEPRVAMPEAKRAAERAVALDDRLAESHTALAQVLNNYEWDWAAAGQSFRRALELSPGFSTARQWYGFHLAATGRLDQSLAMMESALAIDPMSPLACTAVGRIHYFRGEHQRAIPFLERALDLDPHFLPAYILLGMVHVARGDDAEAQRTFERGRELFAGAPVFLAGLAVVDAAGGRENEALATAARLEELRAERYVPAIYLAAIHAALGRTRDAFEWLESAVDERAEVVAFLAVEPLFSPLSGNERLGELLERMGLAGAVERARASRGPLADE